MAELVIQEERTEELFGGNADHFKLNGTINSAYFIREGTKGDSAENNKRFLEDFLMAQEKYPLFLTFITDENVTDKYISFLNRNDIDYTLICLKGKRMYNASLNKYQYQCPCFTVKIKDSTKLILVLEKTYWLTAQNKFFAISYANNLFFQLGNNADSEKIDGHSIATFNVDEESTIITTFHDGYGFYLFSNQKKFSTLEELLANLPKGTLITQINGNSVEE